jgi:hypothetical protein
MSGGSTLGGIGKTELAALFIAHEELLSQVLELLSCVSMLSRIYLLSQNLFPSPKMANEEFSGFESYIDKTKAVNSLVRKDPTGIVNVADSDNEVEVVESAIISERFSKSQSHISKDESIGVNCKPDMDSSQYAEVSEIVNGAKRSLQPCVPGARQGLKALPASSLPSADHRSSKRRKASAGIKRRRGGDGKQDDEDALPENENWIGDSVDVAVVRSLEEEGSFASRWAIVADARHVNLRCR